MTREELRLHPEYAAAMAKIKGYRHGFTFRMDYTEIPVAKGNALKIILRDAVKAGYLESVSMELDLDCNCTAETYRRIKEGADE